MGACQARAYLPATIESSEWGGQFSHKCRIFFWGQVGESCTAILASRDSMIGETGGEDMAVDLDVMPSSKTSQSAPPNKRWVRALVMEADYPGLAVLRSLGRHGIPGRGLKHGDQFP